MASLIISSLVVAATAYIIYKAYAVLEMIITSFFSRKR